MKFRKYILVNFLATVVALFVTTLLVGFIGGGDAQAASAAGMAPRVITLTPTITPTRGTETPTDPHNWVCLRFNFEIGADANRRLSAGPF